MSADDSTTTADDAVDRRGMSSRPRWWPLALAVAVAAAATIGVWLPVWEIMGLVRVLATVLAAGLLLVAIGLWVLMFSGLPRRIRWRIVGVGVAVILVLGAGAASALEIRGFTGDLVPILGWRWATPTDLPAVDESLPAAPGVDLTAVTPHDYPQFLGPRRRPEVEGVRLERDWEKHPPRELWRRPVGKGWSSFAVVGDYAVTQEQRENQELVVCYELKTGDVAWMHADDESYHSVLAGDGPRATPTIDGGRVYTLGASGLLNCLDGADGSRVWATNILEDAIARNAQWGKSCSPLVTERLVVVSAGGDNGMSLLAYDRNTGDLVWGGGDEPSGYSSPAKATILGRDQILIFNMGRGPGADGSVTSHNPVTGEILWQHPWQGENPNIAQPTTIGDDKVFISTGYGHGCALIQVESDENGGFATKELWSNNFLKTKFSNVVVRDGYIYGLDEKVLVCLDSETGKRQWKGGRYGYGQILLVGDVILVQAESGDVVLVEATPEEHRELARMTALYDKTWNCPAFAPPYLLLRNDSEAVCYEMALVKDED